MKKIRFKNKWVLITGASSGLGRELAKILAVEEKSNLIITSRRVDKLKELKNEIEEKTDVKVEVLGFDLNDYDDVEKFFENLIKDYDIYAIFNNAGMTIYEKSKFSSINEYNKMININYKTPMKLSLLFIDYFIKKGEGIILNVTSLGGLMTIPYQNVYSSTKHALQSFTNGLYIEYKNHKNILISLCSPGGIDTEMYVKSGLINKFGKKNPFNMSAEKVARIIIKGIKRKKRLIIPGFLNKLNLFLLRFIPYSLYLKFASDLYKPDKD